MVAALMVTVKRCQTHRRDCSCIPSCVCGRIFAVIVVMFNCLSVSFQTAPNFSLTVSVTQSPFTHKTRGSTPSQFVFTVQIHRSWLKSPVDLPPIIIFSRPDAVYCRVSLVVLLISDYSHMWRWLQWWFSRKNSPRSRPPFDDWWGLCVFYDWFKKKKKT